MKIGIDIRLIGKKQTGGEVVFFNLVKNLAMIDGKNKYCLFTDICDKKILGEIKNKLGISENKNFEIISLPTKNKFSWNFWTLPKYLRQNWVDIYLTQYITPFFVPKKIQIATIIHDISFNFFPQFIKWSDLFFLKILIPLSLRRANKIIGVSRFTRDEIVSYYEISKSKIFWFHNAISDDFLSQDVSDEKINLIKKNYNLPEKYIIYLGTHQPRKNLPTLIEAFALFKLKKENRDIKLVIAGGKGHNYDKRIDISIKNNHLEKEIIFPGYIDENDKAAILKNSQLFCFPSFYEGFGIPILESMAMGVPVVASDILPHREIAGTSASFFNPENPVELAGRFQKILSDEKYKEDLIIKGKEQVEIFSWKKSAEKLLEILTNTKE